MKNLESKIMYLLVGAFLGALIVTAHPIVEHWPDLETRMEMQ